MPEEIPIEDFHETVLVTMIEDFKATNFAEAFDQIADVMAEKTRENFLNESSPSGRRWPELSPATVARKGHDQILVDSTALRKSVVMRNAPGHVEQIGKDKIVYGTDVNYAVFHQEGTSRMPQREFLGVDDKNVDNMADIVADHLVETLKRGGKGTAAAMV